MDTNQDCSDISHRQKRKNTLSRRSLSDKGQNKEEIEPNEQAPQKSKLISSISL
jgi:hypothetical protein